MPSSPRRTSSAACFSWCGAILVAALSLRGSRADEPVPRPAPPGRQNQEAATATVLRPDGLPASRARIAVAVGESGVWVKNGDFEWSKKAARCDADDRGRFQFAAPTDDFSLVITHQSGYLRVRCSPRSMPQTLKLVAWARVEGTLRVGGTLQPDARINIALDDFDQHGPRDPQFYFTNTTTTDNNGSFVFERVVPGRGTITTALAQNSKSHRMPTSSKRVPARFVAGKTTRVDLGEHGRPVAGKLQSQPGSNVSFDRTFVIVDPAKPRDDVQQLTATVDGSGNFCLDDVPVGTYRMIVFAVKGRDAEIVLLRQFSVSEINEKLSQRPIDLGVLTFKPEGRPRARAAPAEE
jgi:hypothetical protein